MITTPIKAKDKNGVLEPLGRVSLHEGDEVIIQFIKKTTTEPGRDDETRVWRDADLASQLPPYDWGKAGKPKGKPVRYEPEKGFVIIDAELTQV